MIIYTFTISGASQLLRPKEVISLRRIQDCETYLVIREDQAVCKNHVLPPSCSEDYYLGDVVWRQRVNTLVHGIGLRLITTKSNK